MEMYFDAFVNKLNRSAAFVNKETRNLAAVASSGKLARVPVTVR